MPQDSQPSDSPSAISGAADALVAPRDATVPHAPGAPGSAAMTGERAALTNVSSHVRFWLLAAAGLWLDLWSKNLAFDSLRFHDVVSVVPNVLEFQLMLNKGALFGIGAGQTSLFLAASVVALLLVLWMFTQSPARSWTLHLALGAILAGALGNMHDRIFVRLHEISDTHPARSGRIIFAERLDERDGLVRLREFPPHAAAREFRRPLEGLSPELGYVRDFLKIPTRWFGGKEIWPWVFNVADALLVTGVCVLAIHLLWPARPPGAQPAAS